MKEEKGNQNNNVSIKKIKALSLNIILPNTQNNNRKKCFYKTTSYKNDLKYKNSTTTAKNDKNKPKRKLVTSLTSGYLKEIQKEIITLCNLVKNKKQKNNKRINSSEVSTQNHTKMNLYNEKKYEKYDKENLAYEIYHDYKKLNFNDKKIPFLKRMELYGIKRNLKEEKINELLKLRSPKISEERRKKTFNNLIKDIKIRKEKKEKEEINSKLNIKKKKMRQKRINEIVKRLYTSKNNLKTKKNIKTNVEKETGTDEDKDKDKDKNLIKEKKKISKCNSHNNLKIIENLNQRLYYKYMKEKDLTYKLFLRKVDELLNHKNNNNDDNFSEDKTKYNSINSDYMSFSDLSNFRQNNKKNGKINLKQKKIKYNFNNGNNYDIINNIENNQSNNNNTPILNNCNILKNDNYSNNNELNSELNSFPKKENNLKISLIIDNFFSNK